MEKHEANDLAGTALLLKEEKDGRHPLALWRYSKTFKSGLKSCCCNLLY